MELNNNSFILSSNQGNLVVAPQTTLVYKDITISGNGYYDWGKIIAQDLVYIMDQIADLKDGGVEQATFDANQFIAQFQASQTDALNLHTEYLLVAIDNKIVAKLAEINSAQQIINDDLLSKITAVDDAYKLADEELNTSIRNDLNDTIDNKINEVQGSIDVLNDAFNSFRNSMENWINTVDPKIEIFSTQFAQFKLSTQTSVSSLETLVDDNYQDLNNKIATLNENNLTIVQTINESTQAYTDNKLAVINEELNTKIDALDPRITVLENSDVNQNLELEDIKSQLPNFMSKDNTILADAKTYTNTEIAKITGPTGPLTALTQNFNTLSSNLVQTIHNEVDADITALEAKDTELNNKIETVKTDLASGLNNIQNSITTATTENKNLIAALTTQVDTVSSGIPQLTNSINSNKDSIDSLTNTIGAQQTQIDSLGTSILNGSDQINNLEQDVLTLQTKTNQLDSKAEQSDVIARDETVLAEANAYTDEAVSLVSQDLDLAKTSLMNGIHSYTDLEIRKLIIPNPDDVDYALTEIATIKGSIGTTTLAVAVLQDDVSMLKQNITDLVNADTGLQATVLAKVNNTINSMDKQLLFVKNNYVAFDTIFPILKKVLGYIIENKITKLDSDELFDNIMKMYSDDLAEQFSIYFKTNLKIFNGKFYLRLVASKDKYKTLTMVSLNDTNLSTTKLSFGSNNSSNIFTPYQNMNYLFNDELSDYYIKLPTGIDLSKLGITISYLNGLGIQSTDNYPIAIDNTNLLFSPFNFNNLLLESNSTFVYIDYFNNLDCNIDSVLMDGVETPIEIIDTQSLNGYFYKLFKLDIGLKDLTSQLTASDINEVKVNYTVGGNTGQTSINIIEQYQFSTGVV